MTDQENGGGASPSTDFAAGSSTATDISLKEYQLLNTHWLDRFYSAEIRHLKEVGDIHRETSALAVSIALTNQKELADKHNDLIRQGEKKDETYATKEQLNVIRDWQSKITGALVLIAIVGVGNFIKLWTG